MKSLIFLFSLTGVLISFGGCSQSEPTKAQDTPKPAAKSLSKNDILATIYTNIIHKNATEAKQQCGKFQQALTSEANKQSLIQPFTHLVVAWKKVEAQYILADLDEQAVDLPRFIDIFHVGNEDITKQLARALKAQDAAEVSLFKNSHNTLNALEFVLFYKDKISPKQLEFAQFISQKLCQRFDKIEALYERHRTTFLQDQAKAMALLLNTLINSSYKLHEWRLGDALGLSRKYQGKPDIRRLEYETSQLSVAAIKAILSAHNELMLNAKQLNFASLIAQMDAQKALEKTQKELQQATVLSNKINTSEELMQQGEPLFAELKKVHNDYYFSLVKSLDVVAKILEADGD